MVSLLLCILFLYGTECTQNDNIDGWRIAHKGAVRETKRLYDCNVMGILCSQKNCAAYADKMKTLPTESIFDNKAQLKVSMAPIDFNGFKLLCVGDNFFRVDVAMSGIVQHEGRLEWVELKPGESGWSVEKVETTRDVEAEKEKKDLEERGAAISKRIPCQAAESICNKNLKSCIQNEMQYPYLTVDVHKEKFTQIATCDDKGKIGGAQCTEVLCTEQGGTDDNEKGRSVDSGIPAIIQCESGNKAQLIYYHISADRWCLSQYEMEESAANPDENAMTLSQMLSKQVGDAEKVAFILKHEYDPFVTSLWFFGDAFKALKDKLPPNAYKRIEEKGLIDWKLRFEDLYPNYKDAFKKWRQCEFDSPETNTNCKSKTVTPWDLLQLAVSQRVLPSALTKTAVVAPRLGVFADKKERKRSRNGGLFAENKSNNFLTLSVLSIVIPIVLLTMTGLYMFYI